MKEKVGQKDFFLNIAYRIFLKLISLTEYNSFSLLLQDSIETATWKITWKSELSTNWFMMLLASWMIQFFARCYIKYMNFYHLKKG